MNCTACGRYAFRKRAVSMLAVYGFSVEYSNRFKLVFNNIVIKKRR
jgi:hypothetical protein